MKRLILNPVLLAGWSVPHKACAVGAAAVRAWLAICMLVFASACSFAPAWPDLPLPENITRENIEELRSRADTRLQVALRECYQRFAVNDCRREALERHRELLHVLRTHELRLNAQDREARQRRLATTPDQRP